MKENIKVKELTDLIKNFKFPPREAFTECMLIAQTEDSRFYKAGIFISQDSTNVYSSISDFWVGSFFCFVENTRLGNLFHDVIPLIHWDELSSMSFTEEYLTLFKEYAPDQFFIETQAYKETYVEFENRTFSDAINILNGSVISSVAKSDKDYVAYFILDDDIGMLQKWSK